MSNSTTSAIFRAVRWVYIVVTVVAACTLLFPGLGLLEYSKERVGGGGRLVELAVGWALLGLLIEHTRGSLLRARQAYLAQALLRISPNLKKLEAARILVRALDSDNESVVETAHQELRRLTGVDQGTDAAAWRKWLAEEQKKEG